MQTIDSRYVELIAVASDIEPIRSKNFGSEPGPTEAKLLIKIK